MLSHCDHAGIFKVNVRSFSGLLGVSMTSGSALVHFNNDKQRVREISASVWLIEDFFVYQYGQNFNLNNQLHESIDKIYKKHGIEKTTVRGLREVKPTPKVKDKDIIDKVDIGNLLHNTEVEFSKNQEDMIVKDMLAVWMKHNPKYQYDVDVDYPALLNLAYKIAKSKNWENKEVIKDKLEACISSWDNIAKFVRQDDFYKKFEIKNLEKNWAGLYQSMLAAKEGSTKPKPITNGVPNSSGAPIPKRLGQ